jgi:hypothetical protein
MFGHIGDDALDVLIRGAVENLFALSPGLEDPGGAQQAEVVAYQGGRLSKLFGDPADGFGFMAYRQNNPKAVWFTHKPECLGQLLNLAIVQYVHMSINTNI